MEKRFIFVNDNFLLTQLLSRAITNYRQDGVSHHPVKPDHSNKGTVIMAKSIVTKFDNYSNAQLADMLGKADAVEKAAKAETDAIKAEIKARGLSEAVGEFFTVTVGESLREGLDTAALKDFLGADYGKFIKIAYIQTARIKACSSAALGLALAA